MKDRLSVSQEPTGQKGPSILKSVADGETIPGANRMKEKNSAIKTPYRADGHVHAPEAGNWGGGLGGRPTRSARR